MRILTREDSAPQFIGSLTPGEVFGYSSAYTYDQVKDMAEQQGIIVSPMPKRSKEYKQYGGYVLKVTKVNQRLKPNILCLGDVRYQVEKAKRPRKCTGYKVPPHLIRAGEHCMVQSTPDELPSCKIVYKKKNYCTSCADFLLGNKILHIIKFRNNLERTYVSSTR